MEIVQPCTRLEITYTVLHSCFWVRKQFKRQKLLDKTNLERSVRLLGRLLGMFGTSGGGGFLVLELALFLLLLLVELGHVKSLVDVLQQRKVNRYLKY